MIKTSLDGLTSNVSTLIDEASRLNDSYTQLSTMSESELSNLASEITALNATVSTVLDSVSQQYSDSSTQTSSSEVNSSSCTMHGSSNDMLTALANNIHGNISLALKNSYGFITNPSVYECNGEGGWRRAFHLITTPSVLEPRISLCLPDVPVEEGVMVFLPVTVSTSTSVEHPTPRSVV